MHWWCGNKKDGKIAAGNRYCVIARTFVWMVLDISQSHAESLGRRTRCSSWCKNHSKTLTLKTPRFCFLRPWTSTSLTGLKLINQSATFRLKLSRWSLALKLTLDSINYCTPLKNQSYTSHLEKSESNLSLMHFNNSCLVHDLVFKSSSFSLTGRHGFHFFGLQKLSYRFVCCLW